MMVTVEMRWLAAKYVDETLILTRQFMRNFIQRKRILAMPIKNGAMSDIMPNVPL